MAMVVTHVANVTEWEKVFKISLHSIMVLYCIGNAEMFRVRFPLEARLNYFNNPTAGRSNFCKDRVGSLCSMNNCLYQ